MEQPRAREHPLIVCGIGRDGSTAALSAAAAEAARLGATLRLVHVIPPTPARAGVRELQATVVAHGSQVLRDAEASARSVSPGLALDDLLVEHSWTAAALVDAAADAELVVLEQTSRGALRRVISAATAQGVAFKSPVPVLNVPRGWDRGERISRPNVVTVAVQDSQDAAELIELACARAAAFDSDLVVLHALPPVHGPAIGEMRSTEVLMHAWVENAHAWLDPIVAEAGRRHPDLKLRAEIVDERPRHAVLAAADVSRLIVVGRRHHERPWGTHLGPVARQALLHASCPVLLPAESAARQVEESVRAAQEEAQSRLDDPTAPGTGAVVVAVADDGPGAGLDFAVEEARRRGTGLHLVHVVQIPVTDSTAQVDLWRVDIAAGHELVARVASQVRTAHPDVTVTTELIERGGVIAGLVTSADRGVVTVLQHRNLNRLHRVIARSISSGVAAHSTVPIVAVPADWAPGTTPGRVVVGIEALGDGSADLLAAAGDEALRRGSELQVVHASWYFGNIDMFALEPALTHEWQDRARHELSQTVTDAVGEQQDELRVTLDVVVAPPAQALVDLVRPEDLLVIGSRHRGLPLGSHLGPVVRTVLDTAPCPVLVVPTRRGDSA